MEGMAFRFQIPKLNSETEIELNLPYGQSLFVLGANGVGKSTLMLKFFQENIENAKRLSWFGCNWTKKATVSYKY